LSRACGGEVPRRADGSAYVCSFDDEFDGAGLDSSKWSVLKTTDYGFHSGPECYVDDGRHVTQSGGVLRLTVTREAEPTDCIVAQTRYLSGMVISAGKFTQTYGRFEIRAKMPPGIGLQPALWLYPQTLTYGKWPHSGEIDIAEAFGLAVPDLLPSLLPDLVWPHLHYQGPLVQAAPGGACNVPGSTTSYHTYAVDWRPTAISFLYDGKPCGTYTWNPAPPLTPPAPFDRPFFILLELALGKVAPDLVNDLLTPFPSTLSVDYVRVWK
jgi:beta-glucanase (GH16 family)